MGLSPTPSQNKGKVLKSADVNVFDLFVEHSVSQKIKLLLLLLTLVERTNLETDSSKMKHSFRFVNEHILNY
jgi:hypothetical protein